MLTTAQRAARTFVVGALLAAVAGGCRTTEKDVNRWANTLQGPTKLVAVLSHDKYEMPLRVKAAMTLVSMRPRNGRRVGIDNLVEALQQLPPPSRSKIVEGMVPLLTEKIQAPPPPHTPGEPAAVDESYPYKDAAFAMLTNEDVTLVSEPAQQAALKDALRQWALADFATRTDDATQKYGMGQILRELGPDGVRGLPDLIAPDAPKVEQISRLIAEIGDTETKVRASQKLVALAKEVNSKAWLDRKAAPLRQANEASGIKVSEQQFTKQLDQYQEEELLRVFEWLKRVGQPPTVKYLTEFALDKAQADKRRAAALAALQGHLDLKSSTTLEPFLALVAADDTPDMVRQLALSRVGEAPRKLVVDRLYQLFGHERWQIRWAAAELVLKMSTADHLEEFMSKLEPVKHMALTEVTLYGALIGKLDGKPPVGSVIGRYLSRNRRAPVRLSALGYYLRAGAPTDIETVRALSGDRQLVPRCAKDAEQCEWKCTISTSQGAEAKEIESVGDFVTHCVLPAMQERASAQPAVKNPPAKK